MRLNIHAMSVLTGLAALVLLSAAQAHAGSSFTPVAEESGWQGPPPRQALPDPGLARGAGDACRLGKQHLRPLLEEGGGLREDDPLTWYDVTYYSLDVDVRQGANSLTGTSLILLTCLQEGLDEIVLHAASNLEIGMVFYDGDTVPTSHDGDLLTVDLQNELASGEEIALEVYYTAQFDGCGVLSTWRTNVQTDQQVHTITTQAEPFVAGCWWPCKDDTRDKADSVKVRVTTDSFNTVVSNGVLLSDVDNGDDTHTVTWFERWPMVTYLVSLCVTEYNHAQTTWEWEGQDMPMHDWSWGLSTGDQQFVLQSGLASLEALSTRYGAYPFLDEKYGHAQYTWGGAMEHQTCSSMGFYNEAVIAHELAHQWFGDKITCDTFHHIWLNEGWATYSEALHFEHHLGTQALHDYMDYEEYFGAGTIYVENPYTDNIFDGNLSYSKGSWVVHMLRHVVGEDAFWQAVHAYLGPNEREFHRTADTDEFRGFMEAAHGADLSWFFDQWIMGQYYPDYEYFWSATPGGIPNSWTVNLGVVQAQTPARQTFSMPVDCRVTYSDGFSETRVLTNDQPAMAYTFIAQGHGEPLSVELDPEDWILGPATRLDAPPYTDIFCTGLRLLTPEGGPLERLPDGGPFQVAFNLFNRGADSGGLDVRLTSPHPDVALGPPVIRPSLSFGGADEVILPGSTLDGIQGLAPITLDVSWEGGAMRLTQSFPAGYPEVLLVDDDGGDEYESYYLAAAEGVLDAQLATPETLPETLDGFGLILWFTGDNRRALGADQWERLSAYWNGGGHVVFTGQDFAEAQDPQLLMSHVGIEVLDSLYDNNAVDTVVDGIFGGRRMYLFNGGAGNQTRMDVLAGLLDCMSPTAYYYNYAGGSAGEELWCGDGGTLVLGFGMEGIADIGNGISLSESLQDLLEWSRGETSLDPAPEVRVPTGFALTGAHPNPFNPATALEWHADRAGMLSGEVFNLAGQRVDVFPPREVGMGPGQLSWQPAGLASGLYVARLELRTAEGDRHASSLKLMLLQ
jgi:aminopeptidase N